MLNNPQSKTKSPAHFLRELLLMLLLPRGRGGILGGVARTIVYLLIAMVLVFLLFWGVMDATSP